MPNVDFRQFVDRFQVIERRLRIVELQTNPQLSIATGKTLTVNESLNLSGASGKTLTLTNSLTVQGGGNTVLSSSGAFTLTIPATGTAALRNVSNTFAARITIQPSSAESTPLQVLTGKTVTDGSSNLMRFTDFAGGNFGSFMFMNSRDSTLSSGIGFRVGNDASNGGQITLGSASAQDEAMYFVIRQGTNADAMRIGPTRLISIGTNSEVAQLAVYQPSSTAAIPTLRLRQADLSEEIIRFDTTVGAGNPINTTALGTYYGRVRVWVESVGEKWLALYNA
jgi:hypothetical protein